MIGLLAPGRNQRSFLAENRRETGAIVAVRELDTELREHAVVSHATIAGRASGTRRVTFGLHESWPCGADLSRDFAVVFATSNGVSVANAENLRAIVKSRKSIGCYDDRGRIFHVNQIEVSL